MRVVYVMDPLCGWCYGFSATLSALHAQFGERVPFVVLPGGMWVGPAAKRQTLALARFIREHDPQVARTTGAHFGAAYLASLDLSTRLLDSEPPSRAIVAVQRFAPERALAFSAAVQRARFHDGLDLNEVETYQRICADLAIDGEKFAATFADTATQRATTAAFAEAMTYANSYPTLLLENGREVERLAEGYAPLERLSAILVSRLPAAAR